MKDLNLGEAVYNFAEVQRQLWAQCAGYSVIATCRRRSAMPNCPVKRGTTTQVVQPPGMNWMPSRVEKRGSGDPKGEGPLSGGCGK